jgi:hypothetical protein
LYVFHPGYWGRHVGYYGGINYGFGYMGVGFVGGMWHGHDFRYNTAVMRVGDGPRWGRDRVYVDRTIVERNTIVNDRHIAFNGGRDGIHYEPRPEERNAMHEQHMGATAVQQQHFQAARSDRSSYARNNSGHPQNAAVDRPMGFHGNPAPVAHPQNNNFNNNRGAYNNNPNRQQPQQRQPQYQQPRGNAQPRNESRPAPQPREESRPQHEEKPHR